MAIWVHLYGWAYNPAVCDGDICPQNCDHCSKADLAMGAEDNEDDDYNQDHGIVQGTGGN